VRGSREYDRRPKKTPTAAACASGQYDERGANLAATPFSATKHQLGVVIFGPAELSRDMASIISQLDIRRALQVLVKRVIAEVSYDRPRKLVACKWGTASRERLSVVIINFNAAGVTVSFGTAAAAAAFLDGSVTTTRRHLR